MSTALDNRLVLLAVSGTPIADGDIMLAGGDRMVRVVACCQADTGFGLLVREGVHRKSDPWSSQWSLQATIKYLALQDHELKKVRMWQTLEHSVFEALN